MNVELTKEQVDMILGWCDVELDNHFESWGDDEERVRWEHYVESVTRLKNQLSMKK